MAKRRVNNFLYWTPRILAILLILFLFLFSLDVVGTKLGFWGTFLNLLMNNIPSLILLIVLIISWKREIVGGIAFILAGIAYIIWAAIRISTNNLPKLNILLWSLIIAGPAFLIGIFFLINWFKKK